MEVSSGKLEKGSENTCAANREIWGVIGTSDTESKYLPAEYHVYQYADPAWSTQMPQLVCKKAWICTDQHYMLHNHHLHVYGC